MDFKCQDLFLDKWTEVEIKGEESEKTEVKDLYDGEELIEQKEEDRYLGDIISVDGRNLKNIRARVNKGTGIVHRIITMLNGIPFGKQFFKVGIILRNSLLVSSMLFNTEAWYNLTIAEVELLETVDLSFLRQLLGAPKTTPKEMMYLELGIIPFRDIIRARRLNFLHTILNEKSNSLVSRFFEAQLRYKTKRDWVCAVLEDLKYLELSHLGLEGIKVMKKQNFRMLINQKVEETTFRKLEAIKRSHSKVDKIEHNSLIMQKYLQPNTTNIKKEEAQLIFMLRCRMTNVKNNMKGKYVKYQKKVKNIS